MALDPNIFFQSRGAVPNVLSALQSGIAAGQSIRQAPIIEEMQRQQLQQRAAQEQRAAAMAPLQRQLLEANIQNTINPASIASDAQRLEIEKEKLRQRELERQQRESQFQSRAGELKPGVQKILDAAQTEAIESNARARQLGFLASDLEAAGDIGGGAGVRFTEFLKTQLGTQDDVTELRRRYNAIRSSEAVQNLPPGVASDKDIELALKGFPREDAPKDQLVSFLRGSEKLAQFRADFNRIKSEFVSSTGSTRGLLKAIDERLPRVQERFLREDAASTSAVQQPSAVQQTLVQQPAQQQVLRFDAQGNLVQ